MDVFDKHLKKKETVKDIFSNKFSPDILEIMFYYLDKEFYETPKKQQFRVNVPPPKKRTVVRRLSWD